MKILILGAQERYEKYLPQLPFIRQQELVFWDKDTRQALGSTLRLFMKAGAKTAASELNPVQLLLRHLPLQKLAEGLESQEPADVPEK